MVKIIFMFLVQARSSCSKSGLQFSLSISGSLTADICLKDLLISIKTNIELSVLNINSG